MILPRGRYVVSFWLKLPSEIPDFGEVRAAFVYRAHELQPSEQITESRMDLVLTPDSIRLRQNILDHQVVQISQVRGFFFPFLSSVVNAFGADSLAAAPWWFWDMPFRIRSNATPVVIELTGPGASILPGFLQEWSVCIEYDCRKVISDEISQAYWTKAWDVGTELDPWFGNK